MRLKWDEPKDRIYETGLDRGVLYLPDGTGVPWNGLVSVEEDFAEEVITPLYLDGVKHVDVSLSHDFAATLTAFTYPDEFLEFEGTGEMAEGLYIDHQEPKLFGLSYRTKIGDGIQGPDRGYKIHLLYNLTAIPQMTNFTSFGNPITITTFNWIISALPEDVPGYKPTAHAIIDSRYLDYRQMEELENLLYGDDIQPPFLPPLSDLTDLIVGWNLIVITDHGDGSWSATGPDDLITMPEPTRFRITGADATYLDSVTYQISSN